MAAAAATWEWKGDDGWHAYSAEDCETLENARERGATTVKISAEYKVNIKGAAAPLTHTRALTIALNTRDVSVQDRRQQQAAGGTQAGAKARRGSGGGGRQHASGKEGARRCRACQCSAPAERSQGHARRPGDEQGLERGACERRSAALGGQAVRSCFF